MLFLRILKILEYAEEIESLSCLSLMECGSRLICTHSASRRLCSLGSEVRRMAWSKSGVCCNVMACSAKVEDQTFLVEMEYLCWSMRFLR